MSYDKEIAERKLDFGEYDELILQEREQKHILIDGEFGSLYAMPSKEYVELRDKYVETVNKIRNKDMTNGDKIRTMTDIELAEFIDKILNQDREDWKPIGCYNCNAYGSHHADKNNIGTEYEYLYECKNCEFENGVIKWLENKKE